VVSEALGLAGNHFRRQNVRVLSARITHGAQQPDILESGGAEFIEEGVRLLGAGDSGEPV